MGIYAFDAQLKHVQEEQERAAQRALRAHEARLALRSSEEKRSLRLAQNLGLLLPRRMRARP